MLFLRSLRAAAPARRRGVAGSAVVTLALAGAALLIAPTSANAATAHVAAGDRSHDPIGHVASIQMTSGGLRMQGWAADPDSLGSRLSYVTLLDGNKVTDGAVTPYAWPRAQKEYHTGPTPGFHITTKVPSGKHTFCLAARNLDAGLAKILRCVALPLGRTLSSSQAAAHSPVGNFAHAYAHPASLHVLGWANDPDFVSRYSVAVLYIDGQSVATRYTHIYRAPRPDGAGYRSRIDISVPVSKGAHVACLWIVNSAMGSNKSLGCRTRDTRGPAGTGAVNTPALNASVVTEAKKHIGQDYVWGATGPSVFDCSGLVVYSYKKFGYTTPRTSSQQRLGARVIPASRAVPGDLVFTHDSTGSVYHVGIYLSPGKTVAAIDTAEGVDYQTIWNPTATSYGSFTHT